VKNFFHSVQLSRRSLTIETFSDQLLSLEDSLAFSVMPAIGGTTLAIGCKTGFPDILFGLVYLICYSYFELFLLPSIASRYHVIMEKSLLY
jgi:hypothetical protein